ncbi:recombinase family protein [Vibrio parahaemolyticus]|uniref:recombinase family protein n=1 Tax=Vibrio parahaemolyticus TaxID=670 RepID=UPI003F654447
MIYTLLGYPSMKIARLYIRVSSSQQDLERQNQIYTDAITAGYYVAGVYKEKASGARADRPELLRLIGDLQPGEIVVAEKIDRISRLPLPDTESKVSHNSWPHATSWGPIGDQIAIYGQILTSHDDFHHRSGWEKWEWWETGSAFTIFLFSNDKQESFSTL